MGFKTLIKLDDSKIYQASGDTINLSGHTTYYGDISIVDGINLKDRILVVDGNNIVKLEKYKHIEIISGDSINNEFTITHNLNTLDIKHEIVENFANYETIFTTFQRTNLNNCKIIFTNPPILGREYRILIYKIITL